MSKYGLAITIDPEIHKLAKFSPSREFTYDYAKSYEGWLQPVQDQGRWGTCCAFGCGAAFEYFLARSNLYKRLTISKRALYSYARHNANLNDPNDQGLTLSQGLNALREFYAAETDWPYNVSTYDQLVEVVPPAIMQLDLEVSDCFWVSPDQEAIRAALAEKGPVVVAFDWATEWEPGLVPSSGVLPDPSDPPPKSGHCVTLVGYDDGRQAFRGRNSWGTGFGDGGYFWLPYHFEQTHPKNWVQQAMVFEFYQGDAVNHSEYSHRE